MLVGFGRVSYKHHCSFRCSSYYVHSYGYLQKIGGLYGSGSTEQLGQSAGKKHSRSGGGGGGGGGGSSSRSGGRGGGGGGGGGGKW